MPEDTKRYQVELKEELVTFILSNIWLFEEAGSGIAETGYFLIDSLLVCCGYFKFGGQEKHGHAANIQGARSQPCCGESPRALG